MPFIDSDSSSADSNEDEDGDVDDIAPAAPQNNDTDAIQQSVFGEQLADDSSTAVHLAQAPQLAATFDDDVGGIPSFWASENPSVESDLEKVSSANAALDEPETNTTEISATHDSEASKETANTVDGPLSAAWSANQIEDAGNQSS